MTNQSTCCNARIMPHHSLLGKFECLNCGKECHTPTDYSKRDHAHCWQEKNPPCGQKIKHFECCLCKELNPDILSKLEQERKDVRVDEYINGTHRVEAIKADLIEKVEGMKKPKCGLCDENIPGAECRCEGDEIGYNQAVTEILALIKDHGKSNS